MYECVYVYIYIYMHKWEHLTLAHICMYIKNQLYIYIYSTVYSINQTSMTCIYIYIHLWRWKPPMSFMGNLSAVYGERVGVAIYIYIVKRENCCPGFVYIYIYPSPQPPVSSPDLRLQSWRGAMWTSPVFFAQGV